MKSIQIPFIDEDIKQFKVGDNVLISGTIVTARDMAHKYLYDNFLVNKQKSISQEDQEVYEKLRAYLHNGAIYHCGPVVRQEGDSYTMLAAGPTTSSREEKYEYEVIQAFNVRFIIGKGGMGDRTLKACQEFGCLYLHAIGGAAPLIAKSIVQVKEILKENFGIPEAFWVIEVKDFPAIVTMDARGDSLHKNIKESSFNKYLSLIS